MKNQIIIVDENDQQIGLADKIEAHTNKPQLHRAITYFLTNKKGEVLITKRALGKLLWPLYWETSGSTHPYPNESYKVCAERRIKEELGISAKMKNLGTFIYRVEYKNIGSENEVCATLIGEISEEPKLNSDEIAEYKFITKEKLLEDIETNPGNFTPWLLPALKVSP